MEQMMLIILTKLQLKNHTNTITINSNIENKLHHLVPALSFTALGSAYDQILLNYWLFAQESIVLTFQWHIQSLGHYKAFPESLGNYKKVYQLSL